MEVASLIISIVVALITGGEVITNALGNIWGSSNAAALGKLAKDVIKKISNNNNYLNQIVNAFNSKNQELASSILRGLGFGPRAKSLADQIEVNNQKLQETYRAVGNQNVELEDLNNRINNLSNRTSAGGGLGYIVNRDSIHKEEESLKEEAQNLLNQNINGGSVNETQQ